MTSMNNFKWKKLAPGLFILWWCILLVMTSMNTINWTYLDLGLSKLWWRRIRKVDNNYNQSMIFWMKWMPMDSIDFFSISVNESALSWITIWIILQLFSFIYQSTHDSAFSKHTVHTVELSWNVDRRLHGGCNGIFLECR